ncbi:MAG: phosphatase PAP2 family protein [Myxococcaceae bacterium]
MYALKMAPTADLTVTAAGGAAWLIAEFFGKKALGPAECLWCDRNLDGADQLNGFDRFGRGARWGFDDQRTAAKLSDAIGFVALPASMVGLEALVAYQDGALSETPNDLLIIAEAAVLSAVVNQTIKFVAQRERPFVHALSSEQRLTTADPHDNNLSFYSGHTSFTFAMATAAGTVAELRGYRNSWLVWAVGMPLAGLTGYLRMAADKHYLSDVLVGAAVGSAFGVGVPLLLHPRNGRLNTGPVTLRVVPSANGVGVVGSF